MSKLSPAMPLGGFEKTWNGFDIREHYHGELVSLACVSGLENTLETTFKKAFGASLPAPNHMHSLNDGLAFWSGQGQYMLLLDGDNIDADRQLSAKLGGAAYTALQSDGWASLDISGRKVFDVLERFIPLDLRRAPAGFAARTSAHHIAVIVMKFSETEFRLLTPRSSAQSFLDGLLHTAKNVLS